MAKKNYTWKLESDVVDKLQLLAYKEHRSLSNYIEWMFINEIFKKHGEELNVPKVVIEKINKLKSLT